MNKGIVSALVSGMMLASPCLAAEDFRDTAPGHHRSGAFVGAKLRLLAGGREAAPQAGLAAGFAHRSWANGQPGRLTVASGVELGVSPKGKASFAVGGQQVSEVRRKLGFDRSTSPFLIAGGVLAAAVVGFLVLRDDDDEAFPVACPPGVQVCAQ